MCVVLQNFGPFFQFRSVFVRERQSPVIKYVEARATIRPVGG